MANYVSTIGAAPDVVVWMLGINAVGTTPLSTLDSTIDAELACADTLIAAMLAAAPSSKQAVVLPHPGNTLDQPFFDSYPDQLYNTSWGFRRRMHRETEKMLAHWPGDGTGSIYLVPSNMSIDRVTGYPNDNAVHPNSTGYGQIAVAVSAFLKWLR
jgi:hypothetical protein